MIKRIIALFLIIIIIFSMSELAFSETQKDIKTKQDKLTLLQKTLNSVNQIVSKLATKEKNLFKEIQKLDREIESREKDIKYLENRLSTLEKETRKTEKEIMRLELAIKDHLEKIKKRLVHLERILRGGVLIFYFNGENNLTDLSKYSKHFGFIFSSDKNLLEESRIKHKELTSKKEDLVVKLEGVAKLKDDLSQKKKDLNRAVSQKESLLEDVQSEKEDYAKRSAELKAQIFKEQREIQSLLKKLEEERKKKGTSTASRSGEGFIWPLIGRITSPFGVWRKYLGRHWGIDIAAPTGTPIIASRSGEVVFTGWRAFYGLTVLIYHGDGIATRYAHFSKILVSKGQWVEQGTIIGLCGSTGYSTGPHLHFEIIINGVHVDPQKWLP